MFFWGDFVPSSWSESYREKEEDSEAPQIDFRIKKKAMLEKINEKFLYR